MDKNKKAAKKAKSVSRAGLSLKSKPDSQQTIVIMPVPADKFPNLTTAIAPSTNAQLEGSEWASDYAMPASFAGSANYGDPLSKVAGYGAIQQTGAPTPDNSFPNLTNMRAQPHMNLRDEQVFPGNYMEPSNVKHTGDYRVMPDYIPPVRMPQVGGQPDGWRVNKDRNIPFMPGATPWAPNDRNSRLREASKKTASGMGGPRMPMAAINNVASLAGRVANAFKGMFGSKTYTFGPTAPTPTPTPRPTPPPQTPPRQAFPAGSKGPGNANFLAPGSKQLPTEYFRNIY